MTLLKTLAIFIFDLIDKYIHQNNILKSLKKEKLDINIFLDIGAHKGKYTDLIIKNFKSKNIFLFEPQEKLFKFLKEKYRNNKKKINISKFGISNKTETKCFYINLHDLTSSIKKENPKNNYLNLKSRLFGTNLKGMIQKKSYIKTIDLKEFLKKKKLKRVDLIKIDTEGHEFEVLTGLGNKIKIVKAILIEFHDNDKYLNYNNIKIEKLLKKNNFILKKRIKMPFTTWEDRLYFNIN